VLHYPGERELDRPRGYQRGPEIRGRHPDLVGILAACGGSEDTDGGTTVQDETTAEESTQASTVAATETATDAVTYVLPGDEVYPEGIALDEATGDFFVGSTTDGTIFRGNVTEPGTEAEVFGAPNSRGVRSTAVGMELVPGGRRAPGRQLLIAGGDTGRIFAYDATGGALIEAIDTPESEMTFINDVAVARGDAYFADSMRPILFRYSPPTSDIEDTVGKLEEWLDLEGTPIEYGEGFNLNGIAATGDGRYLVTVQSNTGNLYRVDTESREITQIDLGGEALTGGDGILLYGQTLYVVRGGDGVIVPVELSEDFTSGEVGEAFSDPSFARPTTIAKFGDRLLVVNSQGDRGESGESPELPFTVSAIEVP
jgi:sugar lactone lactonase YvrE